MKRRTVLAGLACAGTTTLAGCQSDDQEADDNEETCSQGETAIKDITNDSGNEVTVGGVVSDNDEQPPSFTLDGQTGVVDVFPATGPPPSESDCLRVSGTVGDCIGCDNNEYYIHSAVFEQS